MSRKTKTIFLLLFLLAFRTVFGLAKPFYGAGEIDRDSLQTYLIGLKCYTTRTWPYFGPDQYRSDINFYSQMAGALEGSVIAASFYILPIPEAPYFLLNLLSFTAIALLAWYASRRMRGLSFSFALAWLSLLPWTLNESTHVINPSFLLFGSSLFFLGFLEALPGFTLGWITPEGCFALMGFGLFWDMQFHNSWVLLPPFILAVFMGRRWRGIRGWGGEILFFFVGSLGPLVFLVPTLWKYGLQNQAGGLEHVASGFNAENFKAFWTILARYLSLPSFEMPRFLGTSTHERLGFLQAAPWLWPPALFLTLTGWFQPFVLLGRWCWSLWNILRTFFSRGTFKPIPSSGLLLLQWTALAGFIGTWVCFWFTSTGPASHMYYILLPLLALFSLDTWVLLKPSKFWRWFGLACLVAGLWFQTGALVKGFSERSIYTDRDRVVRAIQGKDYRILWERRKWALY